MPAYCERRYTISRVEHARTSSDSGSTPISGKGLQYGNRGHDVLPLWLAGDPLAVDGVAPIYVDAGIIHTLRDLNRRGLVTEFSCQGDMSDEPFHGYFSFVELADMLAAVAYFEERLAHEPEVAQRFAWGPDQTARGANEWALRVHRRQGHWSFSIHMPAVWIRIVEEEVSRRML